MSPRMEQQTSGRKQQDIHQVSKSNDTQGPALLGLLRGLTVPLKGGEESRRENEGGVSAIGRRSRPGEAAEPE